MSAIGNFGGLGLIKAPWDSVVLAVLAAGLTVWGTRSGIRSMRARPSSSTSSASSSSTPRSSTWRARGCKVGGPCPTAVIVLTLRA